MSKKSEEQGGGLAIIEASQFAGLSTGVSAVRENLEATGETLNASDLVRVPTPPAGGTTWVISSPSGDENAKALTGVLCFYSKCGVLWPSHDPVPGSMPVLRTWDCEVAEQVGPIPADMLDVLEACRTGERTFDWNHCGYNQWGSGKNGIGKRCREQRLLFILRQGALLPLLVTVQPGSLKNVVKFVKSLGLQSQVPYYRAVVELTLEKVANKGGQPYSRIVPRLVGVLSAEDGEKVRTLWTEPLSKIVRNVTIDADGDVDGDEVEG